MAQKTGTHGLLTLLSMTSSTVAQVGIDLVAATLAEDLARFNAIVKGDLIGSLADVTTDRLRAGGASNNDGQMYELDQYGRPPTQLQGVAPTVGFPLKLFGFGLGWTEKWMQLKTPADVAMQQQDAQMAYTKALRRDLKRAIYLSANYSVVDKLGGDGVTLNIKRLLNADSAAIPNGPNGEVYNAATHTHYTAEAALTAAGLLAAVNNVVEHGVTGPVVVAIAAADEAAVRGLAGFIAAIDPRLVLGGGFTASTPSAPLALYDMNNVRIGNFGRSEVWVKPWAIASYALVFDGGGSMKPLAMRQRSADTLQGLRLAATTSLFPLTAENYEAEFGFGVWARAKAAVHFFAGGTYTDPVIT